MNCSIGCQIHYRKTHFIMTSFFLFRWRFYLRWFLVVCYCNHKMIDVIAFQKCLMALTQWFPIQPFKSPITHKKKTSLTYKYYSHIKIDFKCRYKIFLTIWNRNALIYFMDFCVFSSWNILIFFYKRLFSRRWSSSDQSLECMALISIWKVSHASHFLF